MSTWTSISLPDDYPPPKGPYSPAVRAGDFVYISGQTPRDPRTGGIVGDDIATQSRVTLSNVQRLVERAGAGLRDVVSVTIYLARMEDWAAVNTVYTDFFVNPYPSRTVVGCELRDILIEVSAVVYAPKRDS